MSLDTRFWQKLIVIAVQVEIFRSLRVHSTPFYTPNASRAIFSARKMSLVTRFWRKLIVISVLFEILRCLCALSTPFYTPNVVWATLSSSQNVSCYSILTKLNRYSGPVWDISTFKHSFHWILHAEHIARHFEQLAKCHLSLEFDENYSLFRCCLRYFEV
jgi:hypothetical protein